MLVGTKLNVLPRDASTLPPTYYATKKKLSIRGYQVETEIGPHRKVVNIQPQYPATLWCLWLAYLGTYPRYNLTYLTLPGSTPWLASWMAKIRKYT